MNRTASFLRVLVVVAALGLVAACAPSSGDGGTVAPPPSTTAPSVEPPTHDATPGTPEPSATPTASPGGSASPSPSASPTPAPTAAGTTIVRAYFLMPDANGDPGLVPVLREIPATKAVGTAAMQELLEGPNATERAARPALTTVIPEGTRLLGLRIENRIAIVDLSREFESGGGSLSIFARLAQVVYTLTQFPTVDGVSFELDGVPVTIFSGEGIMLDEPVSREDYQDSLLPEIFVDRPAWGASAGNPARITGLTRVFEATFQVRIIDGSGDVVAERTVMATCGTGCWGTFDVTVPYTVARSQWGTLRVFEYSAKDGTPQNIRDYPVWLTPAK